MSWLTRIAATDDGALRLSLLPRTNTNWQFSLPPLKKKKKRKKNVHKKERKSNRKGNY